MTGMILPPAWLNLISRVRSVLPSAIIAGGALRDLDNMRPVKDIDVFYTESTDKLDGIHAALDGEYRYSRMCPGEYLDGAAQEVTGTVTFLSVDDRMPELNLIQLDPSFNVDSIIHRVDFGLCQIGFDQNGVVKTEAYEHDKLNRRFTLTRAETLEGTLRSLKRYDRLAQKYVGWDLYWLPEHDALVKEALAYHNCVLNVKVAF